MSNHSLTSEQFSNLVQRVIQQESGGNPNAVSPKGAAGLMQIMAATAQDPGFGVSPISAQDRFDPVKNQAFGESYLQAMLNRYNGNTERALVAFNAGPGVADKWNGNRATLPKETQGYLKNIQGVRPIARPQQAQQFDGLFDALRDPEFNANFVDTLTQQQQAQPVQFAPRPVGEIGRRDANLQPYLSLFQSLGV